MNLTAREHILIALQELGNSEEEANSILDEYTNDIIAGYNIVKYYAI